MKKLILFSMVVFMQSCSPVILVDKSDLSKIPKGSTRVISHNQYSPNEVFSIVAKSMAKSGCPVKSDRESMQIICDGKSIEGGTVIKAMAFVEAEGDSSKVTFSGEWGLDANGQIMMSAMTGMHGLSGASRIEWEGVAGTKPCVAYQHLILMARGIPNGKIKYGRKQ